MVCRSGSLESKILPRKRQKPGGNAALEGKTEKKCFVEVFCRNTGATVVQEVELVAQ